MGLRSWTPAFRQGERKRRHPVNDGDLLVFESVHTFVFLCKSSTSPLWRFILSISIMA